MTVLQFRCTHREFHQVNHRFFIDTFVVLIPSILLFVRPPNLTFIKVFLRSSPTVPVSSLADDIVLRNRTQRICEGRSYHSPANCDRIMLVLSTVEHNYLVVDVCYLLHKYQLHVSVLMAIFRLNELTKTQAEISYPHPINPPPPYIRRMPNITAYVFCQFIQPEDDHKRRNM